MRDQLARMILTKVAGPDPQAERDRVHQTPGPRWLRGPWGRLQRTSYFLAITTYGAVPDAEAAIARVRSVHERVRGANYQASDPHLLKWVHVAEVDSFLTAHQTYGAHPLNAAEQDKYVEQSALVAGKLGVIDPPTTVAELRRTLTTYQPELRGTTEARQAARFILVHPPVPWAARPAYGVLTAAAVSLLPWWARWPLRLPYFPLTEQTLVRAAGDGLTRTIRWALTSPTLGETDRIA